MTLYVIILPETVPDTFVPSLTPLFLPGLNRLYYAFNMRPQVRGTRGHLGDFDVGFPEDLIEGGWVFHVVIAEEDRQREIGDLRMLLEPLRLLRDPGCVWLSSRWRKPESA